MTDILSVKHCETEDPSYKARIILRADIHKVLTEHGASRHVAVNADCGPPTTAERAGVRLLLHTPL